MAICTSCGLPTSHCDCTDTQPTYDDVTYVGDIVIPDTWQDRFLTTYARVDTDSWVNHGRSVEPTPTNVRRAMDSAVLTVNTQTRSAEKQAERVSTGDFAVDKDAFLSTTDGHTKWDKRSQWYASEVPEQVAGELQDGNYSHAVVRMTGHNPDTGVREYDSYLRTQKGHFAGELLGDPDALCLDRRKFRALKPILRESLTERYRAHPDTEDSRMRQNTHYHNGSEYDLLEHKTADSLSRDFWCDGLARNEREWRVITTELLDAIVAETGVERRAVPITLFNMAGTGDTTVHSEIINAFEHEE